MRMLEIDAVGMYDTAAEEMGKVFVTTELGGGGTASRRNGGDRQARRDQRAAPCRHCRRQRPTRTTRWLDMPSGDCFSFAEDDGLIEPLVDLGETV